MINSKKTGIYRLNCGDCPSFYIGQTGRDFKTRFKEHMPSRHTDSNYAKHLVETGHSCHGMETNMEVLKICSKGKMMDVMEDYEIYKSTKNNQNNLLNEKSTNSRNEIFDSIFRLEEAAREKGEIKL